jgi:hypothetical protein
MRGFRRVALIVALAACAAPSLYADHFTADCPLTLTGQSSLPLTSGAFAQSPHGVFRSGSLVYVLRGGQIATYNVSDVGDLGTPVREDTVGSMASREANGAAAFNNGFLYLATEAGLEVFDLRNTRAGGNAPIRQTIVPNVHYRRIAVSGNVLAGVYPATDMPCYVNSTPGCSNQIDLWNIAVPSSPSRTGSITSVGSFALGWNDVAFNYGLLFAAGEGGTYAFNVSNPAFPNAIMSIGNAGKFLVSNGTNFLGIGTDTSILMSTVLPNGVITPFATYTIPNLQVERSNPIVFQRQAYIDDATGRLITLVAELDPQTLQYARTLAFDVFDFDTPMYEGSDPRLYEAVSYVTPDEVKWNPTVVGQTVYVVGELNGLQTYGACGQMTGKFDWDGLTALNCGGTNLTGWVTGDQKIASVEVLLDAGSLGTAVLNTIPRADVSSRTPVSSFVMKNVNLDNTARGTHILRAIGTDAFGNRRQFAALPVFFPGPGANCTSRRRALH